MGHNITVAIADDHPLIHRGIQAMIGLEEDIELVGSANTTDEIVEIARNHQPSVILMDVRLPTTSGIDATRRILQEFPDTKILMLTMTTDERTIFAAMMSGAAGYLLKETDPKKLMEIIRLAHQGYPQFSPTIAPILLDYTKKTGGNKFNVLFDQFTSQEQKVLIALSKGMDVDQIAETLGVKIKTVRNYVSIILTKMGVADRLQAAIIAREAGLHEIDLFG